MKGKGRMLARLRRKPPYDDYHIMTYTEANQRMLDWNALEEEEKTENKNCCTKREEEKKELKRKKKTLRMRSKKIVRVT